VRNEGRGEEEFFNSTLFSLKILEGRGGELKGTESLLPSLLGEFGCGRESDL